MSTVIDGKRSDGIRTSVSMHDAMYIQLVAWIMNRDKMDSKKARVRANDLIRKWIGENLDSNAVQRLILVKTMSDPLLENYLTLVREDSNED